LKEIDIVSVCEPFWRAHTHSRFDSLVLNIYIRTAKS